VSARAVVAGTLVATVLASVAPDARANGRFPAASQLVVAPTDPTFMALRTTFGIVVSSDAGATWDWICESAVGYGKNVEDPPIAITADKTIVLGLQEGLGVTTNGGCDWRFVGGDVASVPIVDVVVRPDAPHTVLALASAQTGASDAGDPLFASQVFRSTDDGATWSKLGLPLDPTYILETLEVAASDPHRLYASGVRGSGATTSATMFVSIDDGATWTPRAVPFDPVSDRAPFVAGVDPTDADRVYVRTSGTNANNLFVSADAGKGFTKILSALQLYGFAQSPDGARVFAGGPAFGLASASRADYAFSHASDVAVQCLTRSGTKLFACSNETDPPDAFKFFVGESDDDGVTFAPRLRMNGVRGPLACDADAGESACVAQWPGIRKALGVLDAGADAGAGATDAGAAPRALTPSCGCGATPADAGGALGLVGLVAALAFLARRASEKQE
jgi:hypothetical protein